MPAPSHSLTMPTSFASFAGSLNVSSALVSSARPLSLVRAAGAAGFAAAAAPPAAAARAFFLAARVRFQSDLFFEARHCLYA